MMINHQAPSLPRYYYRTTLGSVLETRCRAAIDAFEGLQIRNAIALLASAKERAIEAASNAVEHAFPILLPHYTRVRPQNVMPCCHRRVQGAADSQRYCSASVGEGASNRGCIQCWGACVSILVLAASASADANHERCCRASRRIIRRSPQLRIVSCLEYPNLSPKAGGGS